jgi:hypothetical protein
MQGDGVSDHAVFVSVRVANLSQQTVLVPVSAVPELDYMFTVVGPDGRPAPPTKDAGKHRRTIQFSNTVGPLKPENLSLRKHALPINGNVRGCAKGSPATANPPWHSPEERSSHTYRTI